MTSRPTIPPPPPPSAPIMRGSDVRARRRSPRRWPGPSWSSRWSPPTRRWPRREAAATLIAPGALYCDFNSVAPGTKQAAARAIEAAGGRYVDVAVMAPVHPARLAVPLLVSGPHADAALAALCAIGFAPRRDRGAGRPRLDDQDDPLGDGQGDRGADRRMLPRRARGAGVADEVLASLDAELAGRRLGGAGRLQSRPDARAWPAPRRRDGRGRQDARGARRRAGDDARHGRAPARDRRWQPPRLGASTRP